MSRIGNCQPREAGLDSLPLSLYIRERRCAQKPYHPHLVIFKPLKSLTSIIAYVRCAAEYYAVCGAVSGDAAGVPAS